MNNITIRSSVKGLVCLCYLLIMMLPLSVRWKYRISTLYLSTLSDKELEELKKLMRENLL